MSSNLDDFKGENPLPPGGNSDARWVGLKEDPLFFEAILSSVAGGESITAFAQARKLPPNRVNAWLHDLKDTDPRKRQYENARVARASLFADRILEINEDVRRGDITPAQGRLMSDNLRWIAARLDPHLWGDKVKLDAEIKDTTAMHLAAVTAMAEKVRVRAVERAPIDGEVVRDGD